MKIVESAVDAMFKKNINQANSTWTMRDETIEKLRKLDEAVLKLNSDVSLPLGLILDSIDRICDYGCNISEIAINSAVTTNHK